MPTNLELLEQTIEAGFPLGEDVPTALADPERVARVREALSAIADDDLAVEMVGDESFRIEGRGFDGFLEGWRDWAGTFERFRVEVDDAIESGSHVLTFVRQIGTPRGGTTELENEGAAVWTFENGRLVRIEFHLDRDMAMRAAGLDPQSGQE